MTSFYNLHVGDNVKIKDVVHTIRGKSLGRNWKAIRTNAGLIPVANKQRFEVLPVKKSRAAAKRKPKAG